MLDMQFINLNGTGGGFDKIGAGPGKFSYAFFKDNDTNQIDPATGQVLNTHAAIRQNFIYEGLPTNPGGPSTATSPSSPARAATRPPPAAATRATTAGRPRCCTNRKSWAAATPSASSTVSAPAPTSASAARATRASAVRPARNTAPTSS